MFTGIIVGAAESILEINIKEYIPIIAMLLILATVFLLFKLFHVGTKLLWRLLVNGLVGAALLFLFNLLLSTCFDMHFFEIPITWVSAVVAGTLGVPGVLLLLLFKYI